MLNYIGDFVEEHIIELLNTILFAFTCYFTYSIPIRIFNITKEKEEESQKMQEKMKIYASIMKTRRFQLDPEHVASLNLVQVFFHSDQLVIEKYKSYIKLLSRRMPPEPDDAFFKEQDDAFVELLHAIAKCIGLAQDRKEIEDLAYHPTGWVNERNNSARINALIIELLENRRALAIATSIRTEGKNPFPPTPS